MGFIDDLARQYDDERVRQEEQLRLAEEAAIEEQRKAEEQEAYDQTFIGSIKKDIRETIKDPLYAVPALAEMGGAVLGTLGLGPVGPVVGGMAGRALGEIIYSAVRDKPLFTAENAYEILSAPIADLALSGAITVGKRALGIAGRNLTGQLVEPIVKDIDIPKSIEEAVINGHKEAFLKRELAYYEQPLENIQGIWEGIKKAAEPDVPNGYTRVYRALPERGKARVDRKQGITADLELEIVGQETTATGKVKDIIKDVGPTTGGQAEGVFFTRKRRLAEEQLGKDAGGNPFGTVRYVDIPNFRLQELEQKTGLQTFEKPADYLLLDKTVAKNALYHKLPNLTDAERAIEKQMLIREQYSGELERMNQVKNQAWVPGFIRDTNHAKAMQYFDKKTLGDLEKAGKSVGIAPGMWDKQVVLRKAGLHHLGDQLITDEAIKDNTFEYFNNKMVTIAEKYGGITDADHAALTFFHYNKDKVDDVLNGRFPDAMPAAVKATYTRMASLTREMNDEIRDGTFFMQYTANPDPTSLALWQKNYVQTTSLAHQSVQTLQDDLSRAQGIMELLPAAMKDGDYGQTLARQIGALERSLLASAAGEKAASHAMQVAREHYERFGFVPGKKEGSFLDKNYDLAFGSNYFEIAADQMRGQINKAVSDITMPGIRHLIEAVDDPAKRKYAVDAALSNSGFMKASQISNTANKFKTADALPQAVRDYLGDSRNLTKIYNNVGKWEYLTKIALNPAFGPMNLMSHMLTTRHIVKDEALAYGYAQGTKAMGEMLQGGGKTASELFQRAHAAGIIKSGTDKVITEYGLEAKQSKSFRILNAIPEYTEVYNRLVAFAAGEHAAAAGGMTGEAVQKYAREVVRMTQGGYSVAERPVLASSATGAMLFRFKKFGINYAHFLKNLLNQKKYNEFGEAIGSLLALSGTGVVPAYSFVRSGAAAMGMYLPEIDPMEQMTGFSLGNGMSPFPLPPTTVAGLLGPTLGPAAQTLEGIAAGDTYKVSAGLSNLMLGGTAKVVRGAAELARGGVSKTPAGQPQTERSTSAILKSISGLGPQAQQTRGKLFRDMQLALRSGDREAEYRVTKEMYRRGIQNVSKVKAAAKGANTRGDDMSVIGAMLGY